MATAIARQLWVVSHSVTTHIDFLDFLPKLKEVVPFDVLNTYVRQNLPIIDLEHGMDPRTVNMGYVNLYLFPRGSLDARGK